MIKKDYCEEYMNLATHCYLVVMCYEKYLLDEIDCQRLAVIMKELHDSLPQIILDPKRLLEGRKSP